MALRWCKRCDSVEVGHSRARDGASRGYVSIVHGGNWCTMILVQVCMREEVFVAKGLRAIKFED